eukprot:GEZU01032407.1.p2 GENE.GEZU01032407.1~~GEZU01032407.1.p2  ORF type:complete len:168 (-),score=98.10 GEZU01032407.1:76-579(-)
MKIYKDVFSGDELISDSFELNEVDDVVFEVKGKMITKGADEIKLEGANASAEEAEESMDNTTQVVNNIVDAFRLQETSYDKKAYMSYIKGYMKRVADYLQENNPSRLDAFKAGAQTFVKKVLGEFNEYQFFTGESMDHESMLVLCKFKEDQNPYLYFFKDGMKMEKY